MSQLTQEQRYKMEVLLQENYSQTDIAKLINKDKSVVCREIKRNSDKRNAIYRADLAIKKCNHRHQTKRKKVYFTDTVKSHVEAYLNEDYSPDQIAGTAKLSGVICVSHERIYQHIWQDKHKGGKLYEHLRTHGKRYRKRGSAKDKRGIIVGRVGIEKRPIEVEQKARLGDLEIDLVIGKDHKGALLTINDRATGIVKIAKVESKESGNIEKVCIETLKDWQPFLHTITSDNGKEFANHKNIANALNINYYFANPYHSWERGANENLNGLIRQYFPKKSEFENITNEEIKNVEEKLNNRPRKRFGYQTPNYIFLQKIKPLEKVAFIT